MFFSFPSPLSTQCSNGHSASRGQTGHSRPQVASVTHVPRPLQIISWSPPGSLPNALPPQGSPGTRPASRPPTLPEHPSLMARALTTAARSGRHCRGTCWGPGQGPGPHARLRHSRSLPPPFSRRLFPRPRPRPMTPSRKPRPGTRGTLDASGSLGYAFFRACAESHGLASQLLQRAAVAVGDLASGLEERGKRDPTA